MSKASAIPVAAALRAMPRDHMTRTLLYIYVVEASVGGNSLRYANEMQYDCRGTPMLPL